MPEHDGLDERSQKQFGNNSETIRNPAPPAQPALASEAVPVMKILPYKKIGNVGRKRRYETVGPRGEQPVCNVIYARYELGSFGAGMSDDMKTYYEYWYFTKPNRQKDGEQYERHVKSYERAKKWLIERYGPDAGSKKIIAYRQRTGS